MPLVMIPWLIYLGVTVVAPALRGSATRPEFWPHVAITIGVSGLVLGMWWSIARWSGRRIDCHLNELCRTMKARAVDEEPAHAMHFTALVDGAGLGFARRLWPRPGSDRIS